MARSGQSYLVVGHNCHRSTCLAAGGAASAGCCTQARDTQLIRRLGSHSSDSRVNGGRCWQRVSGLSIVKMLRGAKRSISDLYEKALILSTAYC
jgi:hypothetical protein